MADISIHLTDFLICLLLIFEAVCLAYIVACVLTELAVYLCLPHRWRRRIRACGWGRP
jgi:hypothetical protein